jgi:hypothetical protein
LAPERTTFAGTGKGLGQGYFQRTIGVATNIRAVPARSAGLNRGSRAIITWHPSISILVGEGCCCGSVQVFYCLFNTGILDQLLPLQDAANQKTNNHQDDGDLDQGKAFLLA